MTNILVFQARDQSISGISIMKIMQFMSISDEKKLGMFTQLAGFSLPIFKDRTVLILMFLITVFDLESDDSVTRLRNGFLTILRRYLQEQTKNDVEFDMQNIIKCIKALPRVYKIFKEMSLEP